MKIILTKQCAGYKLKTKTLQFKCAFCAGENKKIALTITCSSEN